LAFEGAADAFGYALDERLQFLLTRGARFAGTPGSVSARYAPSSTSTWK
jgi:hypothetical protein